MIPHTMADFVRKQLLKYEGFAFMGVVGDAMDPQGFGLVLQGAKEKKVILWSLKDPEGNGYRRYCTVSTLEGIYWRDEE